jgi:hypothetical protein
MATLEEIGRALKNAHAAGDTASAQKLASAYQREKAKAAQPGGPGKSGMVTEGTISREEYMRQRGPVNASAPSAPDGSLIPMASRSADTLQTDPMGLRALRGAAGMSDKTGGVYGGPVKATETPFMQPVVSEASLRPGFMDANIAETQRALESPQALRSEKMSQAQSAALGVNDLNPARLATGDRGYEAAMTQSLRDNPVTTRFGQAAAFTAGGSAQLGVKALTTAPKLVAPAVAARFAGQSIGAQAARYTGRGALLAGTGAADYYAYNAFAEAPNQFREQGLGRPTVGDRIDYANSQVFTPGGVVAAGLGPAGSIAYRGGRAALAGTKNAVTTGTARPALAAGQTGKAPLTNLFTPSDVQKRVGAISPTTKTRTGRTAREEALDLVIAKGMQPDEAEKLVKLISYDNYANVDEMLFELGNAEVDQLAVAAGRIGGDAKKTLREAFKARNAEMPDKIRTALRDAMGLSGDDLEDFARQMETRADDATSEGYAAAYATQVSDDTWAKIWDRFRVSPDAADALASGSRLAKNSYRGNPAQLEAARQLDELAGALRSPDVTPPKLSTHALDYLDRGFGSLITGAKKNNPAFASSLIEIRNAIRNSGLDADTGLSGPRGVYSQFMAASRALDYGAKAFGRGTPLRDIKKQFAASLKDADEVFEDITGEGRSVIDQALIMGWLRGAEDAVETATNPGALIRQIYGSERQRAKLLEMMPKLSDDALAGVKGDQTKRIRALVGGKRTDGKGSVESIFERQRRMLESQGRVSGNSQTADATEAIFAQGGRQRLVNTIVGAVMNPQEAAKNAALWAVERVTTPAIFKPEVNRELGNILATRGREELLAVIAEIRARQLATGKGPKPAAPPPGGRSPPNAPTPSPQGGPIRSAGFGGFGGKKPPQTYSDLVAEQIMSAKPKRLERAATEADWKAATEDASYAMRRIPGREGDIASITMPDRNGLRIFAQEELAAAILKSRGIDPDPVYSKILSDRPTIAETEVFRKSAGYYSGEAKARERQDADLEQMDDTDAAIEYMSQLKMRDIKPNGPGAPRSGIRDKLENAFALGASTMSIAPPEADAQGAGSAEQARLDELTQLEASAQQQIAEAEQGLKTFRGLSVVEKQKFLKANGFLGRDGLPLAIDGAPEGNTAFAIKAYEAKADEAISAAQAEREDVRGQINDVRVTLAEQGGKTPNPALDKAMEFGSYIGAAYLAHKLRGRGVRVSQASARAIEGQANSLLTRLPVPPDAPQKTMLSRVPVLGNKERARIKSATRAANKAAKAVEERLAGRDVPPISSNPTSPNGLPTREANVNEFDRRGAAGEFGPAGPIGRFMEPVTSRVRTGDLGVMGLGAGDAYVMEGMLEKTRADIDAQEAELQAAREAKDPTRITAARAQLEKLQTIETVQTTFQRIGIGLFAGAALGVTHGQYAKPRPRFEAAARERALIEDFRAPRPPTPPPANAFAPSTPPKKPRTVGKGKPKPKPPVSFSSGRARKAENDNDR